jgi:hypothetical protein
MIEPDPFRSFAQHLRDDFTNAVDTVVRTTSLHNGKKNTVAITPHIL